MQGKGWRILGSVLLFLLLVSVGERTEAGNVLTGNPNIFWAPDGQAFTTDWGERDYVQYPYGMTVQVGERRQQVLGNMSIIRMIRMIFPYQSGECSIRPESVFTEIL